MPIQIRSLKLPIVFWLLLLTLFTFLIRYPYWETIPASFDEINTTIHSFLIAQGKMQPLTGNDSYAGPFYPYLLAGLFRLGVSNLLIGRVVIMIAGVLTVPLTYAWVVSLSGNRTPSLIAALLVASNPDLILVNSHIGGATFLVPFFTTLFLYLLTEGLRRDHPGWLVASAVAAGLALQTNPISVLIVLSGGLWILWQARRKTRLGKWWPIWPIITGLVICLIYSPVIYYNLTTRFDTIDVVQKRSYLWEDNPTVATTLNNLKRLSLQTVRQVSGVVATNETVEALVGFPLVFFGLMVAGIIYTTRTVSALPLVVLLPFWLILPIVSSHYGFLSVGRFTTQLIPVWAAVIGILLAAGIEWFRQTDNSSLNRRLMPAFLVLFCLLLSFYHGYSLFSYYEAVNTSHLSGWDILELSRYAVKENRGERVYISSIEELSFLVGVPYIPHAAFLIGDVYHEFLPPQQIIGRLFEEPGAAFFLLSDHDATILQEVLLLQRVDTPANEEAKRRQYGLYWLDAGTPLSKPDFVITDQKRLPENLWPKAILQQAVQLEGCELPVVVVPGERLVLDCYWELTHTMPDNMYVGFAHLFDPGTNTLITQDDHILGQERYPLNVWQPGEFIQESYTLNLPADLPAAEYQLLLGIYTWPDLTRLTVPDNPDNVVVLPLSVK